MTEKQERECRVFGAFLKIAPTFAGEELAEWASPADENDLPDIRAKTLSGTRISSATFTATRSSPPTPESPRRWLTEFKVLASAVSQPQQSAFGEDAYSNDRRKGGYLWFLPG